MLRAFHSYQALLNYFRSEYPNLDVDDGWTVQCLGVRSHSGAENQELEFGYVLCFNNDRVDLCAVTGASRDFVQFTLTLTNSNWNRFFPNGCYLV